MKAGEKKKKRDAFQRQEKDREKGPAQCLKAEVSFESDLQKEANEEEIGDGIEGFSEMCCFGMPPYQHSDEEGSEVGLETNKLEAPGTNAKREHETAEKQEFAMARAVHDPAQYRSGRDKAGDEKDAPEAREFAGGSGQKKNGKNILHHQNTDGSFAVEGSEITVLIEGLDGEDRTGKAEGEGEENGCGPVQSEGGESEGGDAEDEGSEDEENERAMDGGGGPDFGTGEIAWLKFETDREEEEGDAEVGNRFQVVTAFLTAGLEEEPGEEKANHGWKADLSGQKAEAKCSSDEDGIHEL